MGNLRKGHMFCPWSSSPCWPVHEVPSSTRWLKLEEAGKLAKRFGSQHSDQQGPQQIIFPYCPYSSNLTSPERLGFRGLIILNSEHSSILNHLHSGLIARLCFQTSYFLTEVKPFVVFWMNLHLGSWMSQIFCQQFDSRDISQQSWLVRLCNVKKSLSWWVRWICQWLIYLSNYKLQFTHRTPT